MGSGDKIHVWDSMAGNELCAIDVKTKVSTFMFDGSAIIFVTDDKLAVWDIAGNKERFVSFRSVPSVRCRKLKARGTAGSWWPPKTAPRLGRRQRHVVALYDLKNHEPVHVFDGHKQSVTDLTVSHDGKRLASGSTDGVVKVWDLATVTAAEK